MGYSFVVHAESSPKAFAQRRLIAELCVGIVGVLALAWAWQADVHWFERHWLTFYCVRESKTFRTILMVWAFVAACGILLLFVARPWLGRWVEARSLRNAVTSSARVAAAVLLSLVVSEGLLRLKPREKPGSVPAALLPLARGSGTLVWELEPSHTSKVNIGGRDLEYIVDAHGCRVRKEGEVPDPDKPTVLFAGESLVFGLGVSAEEAYPALVGDRLHVTALNCGVHGYGNDQAYLRTKELLPLIPHLAAVVTVFLSSQIERNVSATRRRLALEPDGTLQVLLPAPPSRLPSLELVDLFRTLVLYHDDEGPRVTRAIFKATAELARAHGAVPIFVVTHCGPCCLPTDGDLPLIVREIFEPDHLSYVKVDIDPEWHVPTDVHPDARGHRKIADAVEGALRAAKIGQ